MTRRRTFLALLGAATAVSGETTASTADEDDSSTEETIDSSTVVEDLEPAEALLAYIVAQYGDRLDEADREVIREGIEGSLASGAAFREVGLENSDEPAYQFSAYRGDRA